MRFLHISYSQVLQVSSPWCKLHRLDWLFQVANSFGGSAYKCRLGVAAERLSQVVCQLRVSEIRVAQTIGQLLDAKAKCSQWQIDRSGLVKRFPCCFSFGSTLGTSKVYKVKSRLFAWTVRIDLHNLNDENCMRPARPFIQLSWRNSSILLAYHQEFKYVFGTRNTHCICAYNKDRAIFLLSKFKRLLVREQVVEHRENLVNGSRDDSELFLDSWRDVFAWADRVDYIIWAKHSVCFTATWLTIRENCHVVAIHQMLKITLCNFLIHMLLFTATIQDAVKRERMLRNRWVQNTRCSDRHLIWTDLPFISNLSPQYSATNNHLHVHRHEIVQ